MITGFRFKDETGETWWESGKNMPAYFWVFRNGNGTGVCMTITYTPR